jgi:hypothetical protein
MFSIFGKNKFYDEKYILLLFTENLNYMIKKKKIKKINLN